MQIIFRVAISSVENRLGSACRAVPLGPAENTAAGRQRTGKSRSEKRVLFVEVWNKKKGQREGAER